MKTIVQRCVGRRYYHTCPSTVTQTWEDTDYLPGDIEDVKSRFPRERYRLAVVEE